MTDIVVVGGHGKVALQALPLLVAGGAQRARVGAQPRARWPAVEATGAHPVIADVEHHDTRGDRHVCCAAAGPSCGPPAPAVASPRRTYAVDRDAAIRTMDAAASVGASRFIMVSYFGAGPDLDVEPDSSFFPYAQAKSAADGHLALTILAWTILRPSRLTDDEPTGQGQRRRRPEGGLGQPR